MLPAEDAQYLESKSYNYEVVADSGFICVVVSDYPLPSGFDWSVSNLLIRLPSGYPDATPDMWWFEPEIRLESTNQFPANADQFEEHIGRRWQRFSRHFPANVWRTGIDGLREYMTLIHTELVRSAAGS